MLILIFINLCLVSFIVFDRFIKAKIQKEDHRLTKGLQLLQNKISILQDLSDRSDEQVKKWIHLIEQKSIEVQKSLNASDEKIVQIETTLSKALDVSKIFYDQVPHSEIADRQKTSKYVQAAKLAHQGFSNEQICQKVDLSPAEVELIIKMNRDQLQFSEHDLPAWIQEGVNSSHDSLAIGQTIQNQQQQELYEFDEQMRRMNKSISNTAFDIAKPDMSTMNSIKEKFNTTLAQHSTKIPQTFLGEVQGTEKTAQGKTVKPFEFRRIVKG